MWFLLLPAAVFLLLLVLRSMVFKTGSAPREHTGRLSHLELVCSVIGTAEVGERRFSCAVQRRVTRLDVIFMSDVVRIELPLVKASQRKNTEKLLFAFAEFDGSRLDAIDNNSNAKIVGYYKGPNEGLATAIAELYQAVFDVAENRPVAFEIDAHTHDAGVISNAWESYYPSNRDPDAETPVAYARVEDILKMRSGCLNQLARYLLLPAVGLSVFYIFGIKATIIFVLFSSLYFSFRRILKRDWGNISEASFWFPLVTPVGAIAALWSSDITFFQLIPSAYCIGFGAVSFFGLLTARSIFPKAKDGTDPMGFTSGEHRYVGFAGVFVCMIGFWVNESLRIQNSLELWIWYFSYFRIEFMVGYLLTLVPVILNSAYRRESSQAAPDIQA